MISSFTIAEAEEIKRAVEALLDFENEVRDVMDGMRDSDFYEPLNDALRRLQDKRRVIHGSGNS